MTIHIKFMDRGVTAHCPPDSRYPHGIDVDLARSGHWTCMVELPYPAPRCGFWIVTCENCGQINIVSAAGRADDPRSVRLGCISRSKRRPA